MPKGQPGMLQPSYLCWATQVSAGRVPAALTSWQAIYIVFQAGKGEQLHRPVRHPLIWVLSDLPRKHMMSGADWDVTCVVSLLLAKGAIMGSDKRRRTAD